MMRGVRNEESSGSSIQSSSTSARGRTQKSRRKIVFVRRHSREEHYEGPIRYCHHNLLAPRWMSWSEGNPGRRFYGSPNYYQDGGCGYFEWHDGVFGDRENAVIKDLLTDIDKLYEENNHLRRGNACARNYQDAVAVEGKAGYELKKVQLKLRLALATLLLTWVVLVVMKL
ncbi:hypothetical protein QN277_019972 [Acacia crassicarpa]|uniref:Zinc finger GRF-type domain-containing protein n=1 Tax=Acacia crassicarpa TaxID=499986 RepID=A0AAE1MMU1_9FABA|nr:hypothetical protein QN277_019972 [Acacia crassicarpa]